MALAQRYQAQPAWQPSEEFIWDRQQQRALRRQQMRRRRRYLALGLVGLALAFGCVVSGLIVGKEYYRVRQLEDKIVQQQLLCQQEQINLLAASSLPRLEQLAQDRLGLRRPDKIKFVYDRPAQAALAAR